MVNTGTDVRAAARRLHRISATLALVNSLVLGVVVVVGVAVAALSDDNGTRIVGVVVAVGGVFSWLCSTLLCAAGMAVASYIEFRVQ